MVWQMMRKSNMRSINFTRLSSSNPLYSLRANDASAVRATCCDERSIFVSKEILHQLTFVVFNKFNGHRTATLNPFAGRSRHIWPCSTHARPATCHQWRADLAMSRRVAMWGLGLVAQSQLVGWSGRGGAGGRWFRHDERVQFIML